MTAAMFASEDGRVWVVFIPAAVVFAIFPLGCEFLWTLAVNGATFDSDHLLIASFIANVYSELVN